MNNLLDVLYTSITNEEMYLAALEGLVCGEIAIQRMKRGMDQKQFAEFMGVSQRTVAKWENGRNNFTLKTLVRIAYKLELPLQSPIALSKPAREKGKVNCPKKQDS